MIIGKSLTALGGGGLKPEIIVTAKAGALLNLHYKDSSIILQSYQLGESDTQHTFVVNVSETAYVVEDVTNSKSVEVLVDAVARYAVTIEYELYIFDYTDGGMKVAYTYISNSYDQYLPTVSATEIRGKCTSTTSGWNAYVINEDIDVSMYNYVYAEIVSNHSGNSEFYLAQPRVLEPRYFGSSYVGVYLDNKLATTGGKQAKISVKMTANSIRIIKFTDSIPSGSIKI